MCGICGIIEYGKNIDNLCDIEKMITAIRHRGPDGTGFFMKNNIALGHARLSIIDIETGKQPMSNEDDSLWVTFNGEIYNYKEIKDELKQKGHIFKSNSDTEIIVHSYEEWGKDCLKRFRGMFAFCVADYKNNEIFLARDQFGIKPLYYRKEKDYLAFSSELNAFKELGGKKLEGSLQSVDYFLRYQYIPTPFTIYKNVYKLPPGSYMTIKSNGESEGPVIFWDLEFKCKKNISEKEWLERIEKTIEDSVEAQLVSDVPFGVFLSGGVDSTLVALKMKKILKKPIMAFSIGFEEEGYSELEYAKKAAAKIGLDLHCEIMKPMNIDLLSDLVYHYGEPFGDSSMVATWYVSKLARKYVPMVLSGDGGDESFGGYSSYESWMEKDRKLSITEYFFGHNLDEWQKRILYMNKELRESLWKKEFYQISEKACPLFVQASNKAKNFDRLAYAQYLDFKTYLPCCILTKVDIASMYHGLEVRPPILDIKLAEIFSQLPVDIRYRKIAGGKHIGKYALKKILNKYFDDDFVYRNKQGFAIPRHRWFLKEGLWRNDLERIVLDKESQMYDWFDIKSVEKLLDDHSESQDNSSPLWLLFVLGIWLKKNPEVIFS